MKYAIRKPVEVQEETPVEVWVEIGENGYPVLMLGKDGTEVPVLRLMEGGVIDRFSMGRKDAEKIGLRLKDGFVPWVREIEDDEF